MHQPVTKRCSKQLVHCFSELDSLHICALVDTGPLSNSHDVLVPLHRYDRMGKVAVQGEPMMDPSAVFAMLFGRLVLVAYSKHPSVGCSACSYRALLVFRRIPPLFKGLPTNRTSLQCSS